MQTRDLRVRNGWIAELLKTRTGDDVETWNVGLTSIDQVDDDVEYWLRRAYAENT